MVERLSNLAYLSNNQSHGGGAGGGYGLAPLFNPRSVSFDIHTPEELAAVNEFLITLGRDVTTTTRAHPVLTRHSTRDFDNHPSHSYFNPAGLNELGLSGMPGIMNSGAGSGASFSDSGMYSTSSAGGFPPYPSRSAHQSVSVPGINFGASQSASLFPDVSSASFPELNGRGDNGFVSSVSTPSSTSDAQLGSPPPFLAHGLDYRSPEMMSPHSAMSTPPTDLGFNFLRAPRGPPPVAEITSLDYPSRTIRNMVPLRSNPDDYRQRSDSNLSKLPKPAPLSDGGSDSDSLYSHLAFGSKEYTLPPLHLPRGGRSPSSSASSSRSGSSTPEPTVLPSFKSITSGVSTERLTRSVRDIEIESQTDEDDEIRSTISEEMVDEAQVEEEKRLEHARLIKDMLIFINSEYKRRYGVPGQKGKNRLVGSRGLMGPGVPGIRRPLSSMDVEMTAV